MSKATFIDENRGVSLDLLAGRNLMVQSECFDPLGSLDSLDEDLLRVAGAVYAADLAVKREEREQHIRTIRLRITVTNFHAFGVVRARLEELLRTLSCDNWTIEFDAGAGIPVSTPRWKKKAGSTLMFSGGLDSFAGAVSLLRTDPRVILVSHITHNRPVKESQELLAAILGKKASPTHVQIPVWCRTIKGAPFPQLGRREDTQRTRSLVFVCLAAVAARLNGSRRIVVMAENGQFAIHLPLSEARIASFSTHTAHPEFLRQIQEVLRVLYTCADLVVTNPFVHLTKGEVVGTLPADARKHIGKTLSCWRASRIPTGFTHCGECVPCLSRRIANETHGIRLKEYQRDLLSEDVGRLPASDLGKRNLSDLCQFALTFAGPAALKHDDEIRATYPELHNRDIDAKEAIAMYRRFANEALAVFKNYPHLAPLLR